GEAPAAGGYFLPRSKAKQAEAAKPKRRGFALHEVDETVLPVLPEEEPDVEITEVDVPEVEAPVVETVEAEVPEVEAPVVEAVEAELPEVELPEAPAAEETAAEESAEDAAEELRYFTRTPAPVEEPAVEETEIVPEPDVPEEPAEELPPVEEAPAEEAPLTRAERKARKKAEKQAAKEAREAEKLAAEEARLAAKAEKAEAKAAAKEAKHAWEDPAKNVSLEEALEGKAEAAPAAAAAAVADFDENARNAEFDATYEEPKASGGALKVLRNIVVTLAALAIVACLALLGYRLVQEKMNARQFTQAATLLQEGESVKDMKAVQKKYPDIAFPADMQAKFGDLYAQNQDLSGWIAIPGTTLDYPVVQTDNDTFYQNHNFKTAASTLGTPFLSTKNDAAELDLNTVVYGQASSKEPLMFSALESYRDKNYFLKHPVIQYSTLYEDYTFKVYAVFVTNAAPEQDNGYVFDYTVPNLGTVESFAGYIDQLNERRLYDTGVDIASTDKLLTLSTSTDDFEHARLVVVGRLLRADESKGVDKTLVKTNKSPRFPQAYYDAAGKTNPYADADKWIPTIS
ncbi:MAG: sortase, partial [Clostridia bacterium]|nr:sortase [Clostridia bacterium]